ncbi:MAG: lytic transglycosylase domain-containing protein [Clostridia bacterium]|nr:lytic transglycosylase domain-containing protein [Clostridia bacterium]
MCSRLARLFLCVILSFLVAFSFVACGFIGKTIYPLNHEELIRNYCDKYDIPYELLAAVIYTESGFDEKAVSRVGAVGLMQLMPSTAEEIAGRLGVEYNEDMLTDPETNIAYGSFYLRYLYRNLGENWDTACAAYNAGIGKVMGWLDNEEYSDDGVTLKSIPIDETRNYVQRVNKYKEKYKELYFNSEVSSHE